MMLAKKIGALAAMFAAMWLMAAIAATSGAPNGDPGAAALSGRVLTRSELQKIYSNRTWYWKDGAAYFQPNRKFVAWVKSGAETTYGEGSWSVANNGQLCIRADWHSLSGDTQAFTCYVHRTSDAIYQRELPRGSWYLFSHIPPKPGDEISRLKLGDFAAPGYLKAKQYVTDELRAQRRKMPKKHPAPSQ